MNSTTPREELRHASREITHLKQIMALLQWDQEVMLPDRAGDSRASQCGLLSTVIHRRLVAPEYGELLDRAAAERDNPTVTDQALLRVMRREYDRHAKLPEEFVAALARLTSRALPVWTKARRHDDFAMFAPLLEEIVAMSRRQADYLGYGAEPYDALLDLHEEGLTAATVRGIFSSGLTEFLGELIRERASGPTVPGPDATEPLAIGDQVRFSERLLSLIGYDFERGRQDVSAHPFTTALGHHDRRITNRYGPHSLEFIFSALHEGGHALYEQGVDEDLADTHLDDGVSLGIHESQSRLWENIIGRGRPFWEFLYPELQQTFPARFRHLSLDGYLAHINRVRPGLIRVEADEASYNLHILIRFELEQGLLTGDLRVADLPGLWNDKYRQHLGVEVDSNANGVLQDVHWAHGALGYFPTYTIGNLAAAQIWRSYCAVDPDHHRTVATGNLGKIRSWLTDHIYRHGAVHQPDLLLRMVTGEPLNSRYFMEYLREKQK